MGTKIGTPSRSVDEKIPHVPAQENYTVCDNGSPPLGGRERRGVRTEITLKNAIDMGNARRGMIKDSEIRQTTVTAVVDTGAITLVINEAIRQKLGLKIQGHRRATLADGAAHDYEVTEPVSVHWKNRDSSCNAYVVPNANNVLLGAIPMEDMDLIVSPKKREVVGAHGDEVVGILY